MMTQHLSRPLHIAFIATYPPRQCGIATFTQDLLRSIQQFYETHPVPGKRALLEVLAMNNRPGEYLFPKEAHFDIHDQNRLEYEEAANFINLTPIQMVSLQHEFGIYGGEDGSHVLHLLELLKKPVVTTLHTVLENPTKGQLAVMKGIGVRSTLLVVMAKHAEELLESVYGISAEKIVMIPHGVPDVPFLDPSFYKEQFQADGRKLILTFGLLSPGKGIEYAIEAMQDIVKVVDDALYIVVGATHPEIKRQSGEQYRIQLEHQVKELGLEESVRFQNRFVTLEQLIQYLVASDLYVSPSLARDQIVSGTLSYALGCGKAVISTRSIYAEEVVSSEIGCLVPFKEPGAIASAAIDILQNKNRRDQYRKHAYQFGRQMIWREVAHLYANTFDLAITQFGHQASAGLPKKGYKRPSLPEINLNHLYHLTDDTGILQHALFNTPNRFHGYCTDDNARALIVAVMNWRVLNQQTILKYIHIYLSFLHFAFNKENGLMRNFMAYDRKWLESSGSEDSHGRTIWGLGYTVHYAPNQGIRGHANQLYKRLLKATHSFQYNRPKAYSILGGLSYLKSFSGDTETKEMVKVLCEALYTEFLKNGDPDWPWCESFLTYGNARLAQALIEGGVYLDHTDMLAQGLKSLQWLVDIQVDSQTGWFSLVGNSSWFFKGKEKSQFDQQPIEIAGLMDACYRAYQATGNAEWMRLIEKGFYWFLGKNDINQPLYDFQSGGCYDGIQPGGVNLNQGAESTLSWLQALHLMWLM